MLSDQQIGAIKADAETPTKPDFKKFRGAEDPNRLSRWFPLILAAGLPVPRTEIVRADNLTELARLWFGEGRTPERTEAEDKLVADVGAAAVRIAGEGRPFFLRTDFTSGKHDWKDTCFVADPSKIRDHLHHLFEFSESADFMGLPWDTFAVRELLPTRPLFTAFHGRMPIVREFRFFVENGEVSHVQPYWPSGSIAEVDDRGERSVLTRDGNRILAPKRPMPQARPGADNWRELLAAASAIRDEEQDYLMAMSLSAAAACAAEHANWSVDWLETDDRGWVLTDMATAEFSYRYDPKAPEETDDQ